ncbi:MAG: 2-phosphoglycerate kinase [Candidatus Lokiarchaeota archaeon]|nr:2-phosphoglycerate kinase [Candidatus Lokiarchaeota archaeon]
MDKIKIIDEEYSILFSRGLVANSLMKTGISFVEAHKIAEDIKNSLLNKNIYEIRKKDMDDYICQFLIDVKNIKYAENFALFNKIIKLEEPIIILIAGTTSVGKSAVALSLAHRLNFRSVIGTDAIREIMRKVLSIDLIPELHQSSYEAGIFSRYNLSSKFNPTILGYSEQSKIVSVGVEALIKRALYEGQNLIIEGVHLCPEFISEEILNHPNVIIVMLHLKDENKHRNRIHNRAKNIAMRRSAEKYLSYFENIRLIQRYLKEQTKIADKKIIENINREETVNKITEVVISYIKKIVEIQKE